MNRSKLLKHRIRRVIKARNNAQQACIQAHDDYDNHVPESKECERGLELLREISFCSRKLKNLNDEIHALAEQIMLRQMNAQERYEYLHDC